jgi:hypothetical protein
MAASEVAASNAMLRDMKTSPLSDPLPALACFFIEPVLLKAY